GSPRYSTRGSCRAMRPVTQWLLMLACAISALLVVEPKSNPSNSTCPPLAMACGMLIHLVVSDRYGLLRRQFAVTGLRAQVLAFLDDAGGAILLLQLQRLGHRQPVG